MTHTELALTLAQKGYRVLPYLRRPDPKRAGKTTKKPQVTNWPTNATRDEATIRSWFDGNPAWMPGIAVGDGFIVVDTDTGTDPADPRPLFRDWAQQNLSEAEYKHAIRTHSGGRHLYYAVPDPEAFRNTAAKSSKDATWANVDVRTSGGFIAVHPEVFDPAKLPDREELPPLPDAVREGLLPKERREISSATDTVRLPKERREISSATDTLGFLERHLDTLDGLWKAYKKVAPAKREGLRAPSETLLDRLIKEMEEAEEGGRNDLLNRLAFVIGNRGLSRPGAKVADALAELAQAALAAGLEESEVHATVDSGARAGERLDKQDRQAVKEMWAEIGEDAGSAASKDDLRLAESFSEGVGGLARYTNLGWYLWCGTHWVRDGVGDSMGRLLTAALRPEIARLERDVRRARRAGEDALVKHLGKVLSEFRSGAFNAPRQKRVLTMATSLPSLRGKVPTEATERITTPEGYVDLRTLELRPHDPSTGGTSIAPTTWVPGARQRLIGTLQATYPDRAKRRYVKSILGQVLLGHPVTELTWLYGDGASGKSTIANGLTAALGLTESGGYAVDGSEALLASGYEGEVARAGLAGARLVWIDETGRQHLDTAAIKKLVNRPRITVRLLGIGQGSIQAQFSVFVATNNMPTSSDRGHGSERRQRVIVHSQQFVEGDGPLSNGQKRADLRLKYHLTDTYWREAFLDLAIWEAHKLLRAGLVSPVAPIESVAETKSALDEADPVATFLSGEVEAGLPEDTVDCEELYRKYQLAQLDAGSPRNWILQEPAFRRRVCDLRQVKWRKRGGRDRQKPNYIGLRLLPYEVAVEDLSALAPL